jgi:hypothetical protein
MTSRTVTLGADDLRALARAAGLAPTQDELRTIAERLSGLLTQLEAVTEDELTGLEPSFVLPVTEARS